MGKQMNYWMDYDSFLLVAQKAVDLGCTIVKEDLSSFKVIEDKDVSIITPYGKHKYINYYFHVIEAGAIEIVYSNGKEYLNCSYNATGNSVIEAGYSFALDEPAGAAKTRRNKELHRARLYCMSGYYDENETYIPRPDCLTKVYHSLVRYVKKIAPYSEITIAPINTKDGDPQEECGHRYKVYITKNCLDMVNNEGYKLY